jgi:putative chitobiose transport system substrate-binding protein
VPPNAGAAEKAVSAGAVSMPYSHTLYVSGVTDYDELRRSLVKAVEAGVTGRQDIKQALDAAAAIWNKKLAHPKTLSMDSRLRGNDKLIAEATP